MKNHRPTGWKVAAFLAALLFAAGAVHAQRGMFQGPQFSGAMAKLFGDHKAFSAAVEIQMENGPGGQSMAMDGQMAFLEGKSRFEMDLSQMRGAAIPPQALAQMKQMGMDKMVSVSIPEENVVRVIYPSMSAYVETTIPKTAGASNNADFKTTVIELGKETFDGHPCVKNKVVMTDQDGVAHESTVWNATDMDKFPAKIESTEDGPKMTMIFKNVKLEKPDAALFSAPSGFKKYNDPMSLMMSRKGGGAP